MASSFEHGERGKSSAYRRMFSKPRSPIPPHPHTPFRFLSALLFTFSVVASPLSALAQSAESAATITAVDTSAFPDMSAYLAVNDAAGNHIPGLPASAFALTENQSPISNLSVSETEVGTQGVIVLDASTAFKARDLNAVTRLDYVKQALTQNTAWMKDGVDDMTVLAPEAVLITHSSVFSDVAQALTSYTTDYAGAANAVPFANHALDLASDTAPRPGMWRYVVFISNGFARSGAEAAVTDLAARANAGRIPIYTVYVGPSGSENTVEAQSLRILAELTGGALFVLDTPESLTPLFQRLADQRTQYLLSYRSALAATGQHTLVASIRLPDGTTLTSGASAFPLRIEPPVIAIREVPATIERIAPQPGADPQTLDPTTYAVPITVDFPDGHPRALAEAQLLVDGQIADTRQAAPIDTLGWPLTNYSESGPHTLQVRATDELGLTAESAVMTVTVAVVMPSGTIAPKASASVPDWAAGLGGLALVVGIVAVVWLWRSRRSRAATASPRAALPKTQPLIPRPRTPNANPRPAPRLALPSLHLPARRAAQPQPLGKAYLEVIEPGGGGASRADIELLGEAVRLGREPSLVQIVFPDRSVSRRHARITETAPGVFQIFDEGSTSGTWVNFTQIPAETGWELKPGDVINLGRVQLRFKRRDTPASTPPGEGQAKPPPA